MGAAAIMKIKPGQNYAVLTGDIVSSTRMAPTLRRKLAKLIERGGTELRRILPAEALTGLDVFSGDAWQGVLDCPSRSLRAAVFLRAFFRANLPQADSRIAIGVGPIDFLPGTQVSRGDGPAFQRSGRLLEAMKKGSRLRFDSGSGAADERWDLTCGLLDALIRNSWTDRRALAVVGELYGWRQEEIGQLWVRQGWQKRPLAQAAVSRNLEGANWTIIARTLALFEADHK